MIAAVLLGGVSIFGGRGRLHGLGNPYFDTSDAGGKKAVEEFGGTYNEVGPQDASPDAQVQ